MTNREAIEQILAAGWDVAMEQMINMDWDFASSCYPDNAKKVIDAAVAKAYELGVAHDFSGKASLAGQTDDELLSSIMAKCEQYWNAHGVCDSEQHASLEFIWNKANELQRRRKP